MPPGRLVLLLLVALAALERLAELRVSRRNGCALRAAGAKETGARISGLWVVTYALLYVSVAAELVLVSRPLSPILATAMAVLLAASFCLRLWVIRSLGPRWTLRLFAPLPSQPLIDSGPYRWTRHPNYTAIIGETLGLTLVGGTYASAIVFVPVMAALLALRIRAEDLVLQARPDYAERMCARPALVPLPRRGAREGARGPG